MQTTRFNELLSEPRPLVMGVLNVTPDSFSDGGLFLAAEVAARRAQEMLAEGADIIDIGGQSTRPRGSAYGSGAPPVTLDEELRRVLPVVDYILSDFPDTIISIDTVKAEVARRALDTGATIINDVSGATEDGAMLSVAASLDAPIILMHGYGPEFQKSTIEEYRYNDVVGQVGAWLERRVEQAHIAGVRTILADVGIGFAKTHEDNLALIRHHAEFDCLGVPMVLGVSRKSTIGRILGGIPPQERVSGSVAAALYGVAHGAKIIRTHDVRQTREALQVWEAISE
ncbi:MAG: dihydropteroate synthase [Bacteroidetes bacterium]|nr:dihydropteroate synthase [Bacteroidota bacterium]